MGYFLAKRNPSQFPRPNKKKRGAVMAKFNKGSSTSLSTKTINLAGGEAFKEDSKVEYVLLLLTSFMEDQYYATKEENQERLLKLMEKIDWPFLTKGALYARHKFGMRSISHVIAAELSRVKDRSLPKRKFFEEIVVRPDDMLEIATYYLTKYGKPLPNSMKRGFADAFNKFDDYVIAKYKKSNLPFKLIDLINLVHPVPTFKNCKSLGALIKGGKFISETWETMLTQAGQGADEEDIEKIKSEAWIKYLNSEKVMYFALLRNLRNILRAVKDKDILKRVATLLTDEKSIKNSRLFPYRFLAAYRELEKCGEPNTRIILPAISKALDIALNNLATPEGETLVIVDVSGSMQDPLSAHSQIKLVDVASLMGIILWKVGADLILFADEARYFSGDPNNSVLSLVGNINGYDLGGCTKLSAGLSLIDKHYDRIILISDMQSWVETKFRQEPVQKVWHKLTEKYGPMKLYSWDLAGYGSLQFPEKEVYLLGGFSEKVFQLMEYIERGPQTLIEEIMAFKVPSSEKRVTSSD